MSKGYSHFPFDIAIIGPNEVAFVSPVADLLVQALQTPSNLLEQMALVIRHVSQRNPDHKFLPRSLLARLLLRSSRESATVRAWLDDALNDPGWSDDGFLLVQILRGGDEDDAEAEHASSQVYRSKTLDELWVERERLMDRFEIKRADFLDFVVVLTYCSLVVREALITQGSPAAKGAAGAARLFVGIEMPPGYDGAEEGFEGLLVKLPLPITASR